MRSIPALKLLSTHWNTDKNHILKKAKSYFKIGKTHNFVKKIIDMENQTQPQSLIENLEFNRFGIISIVLLIVGCLGGLTVGFGAVKEVWSLTLIVIPTMVTLSLLIAVSPMKYIMTSAIIAVLIDFLMITYLAL